LSHARHLAESGHEVTIATNKIDTVFSIGPRIKIIMVPWPGKLGTLLLCLLKKQADSILIADIIVLATILAIRNRKRVIYFAQDADESYYRSSALKLVIYCLYYCGLKLMKIPMMAVSERLAEKLSERFQTAINVVGNGVDVDTFFAEPSPALLKNKEGRKAILLFSRRDWRKGFDIARTVVAKLALRHAVPLEIWTVGEPAAGMFPDLHHRDFSCVDETKMRALYSSADIFLYPSRHEGFGLMVMESFACRCPVVTTEAISFAKNGVNALVSKIGDSDSLANHVQVLLESDELRQTIVEQAFLYATSNTIRKSQKLFEETLRHLVSQQAFMPNPRSKCL